MKQIARLLLSACLFVLADGLSASMQQAATDDVAPASLRSPYQIIEQAPGTDWREARQDRLLYIELETGTVIVELLPEAAPRNSDNLRMLAGEGFYDGLSIYRVVDGFVAQGGDVEGKKTSARGKVRLPGEFVSNSKVLQNFTPVNNGDGYADSSGFLEGFPIGRQGGLWWMLHCPGAFALARGDDPGSGGTEFYFVLGHAPRYLDRNVTVLGTVRDGMAHLQKLNRGQDASGQLEPQRRNPLLRMRVGSDLPADQQSTLQVMRTDSASFLELVQSRANRPEPWFLFRPGFVDTCGIPVPSRVF